VKRRSRAQDVRAPEAAVGQAQTGVLWDRARDETVSGETRFPVRVQRPPGLTTQHQTAAAGEHRVLRLHGDVRGSHQRNGLRPFVEMRPDGRRALAVGRRFDGSDGPRRRGRRIVGRRAAVRREHQGHRRHRGDRSRVPQANFDVAGHDASSSGPISMGRAAPGAAVSRLGGSAHARKSRGRARLASRPGRVVRRFLAHDCCNRGRP
jgi:hypothetical protein